MIAMRSVFFVTQIVAILQLQEQRKEIVQQEQKYNMVTSTYSHSKIFVSFSDCITVIKNAQRNNSNDLAMKP